MLLTTHPDPKRAARELPDDQAALQISAVNGIAFLLQHPQQPSINDQSFRNNPLLVRWLLDYGSALYERENLIPHEDLHGLLAISSYSFGVDWDRNYPLSEVAEAMEQIPMHPDRHAFNLTRIAASRALCELPTINPRLQLWDDRFYFGHEA